MDRAGLLASRVRIDCIRIRPWAFPESLPVAEGNFLAYSCAAARDLHPLPCLRPAAKTRVPKEFKELRVPFDECTGCACGSQISAPPGTGVSFMSTARYLRDASSRSPAFSLAGRGISHGIQPTKFRLHSRFTVTTRRHYLLQRLMRYRTND